MKWYVGTREERGTNFRGCASVRVELVGGSTYPLDLRLDLVGHSPTGLEWGYLGSGPAQLALAILADATSEDELAEALHQQFKQDVIANLDYAGFRLSLTQVLLWVETHRDQAPRPLGTLTLTWNEIGRIVADATKQLETAKDLMLEARKQVAALQREKEQLELGIKLAAEQERERVRRIVRNHLGGMAPVMLADLYGDPRMTLVKPPAPAEVDQVDQ